MTPSGEESQTSTVGPEDYFLDSNNGSVVHELVEKSGIDLSKVMLDNLLALGRKEAKLDDDTAALTVLSASFSHADDYISHDGFSRFEASSHADGFSHADMSVDSDETRRTENISCLTAAFSDMARDLRKDGLSFFGKEMMDTSNDLVDTYSKEIMNDDLVKTADEIMQDNCNDEAVRSLQAALSEISTEFDTAGPGYYASEVSHRATELAEHLACQGHRVAESAHDLVVKGTAYQGDEAVSQTFTDIDNEETWSIPREVTIKKCPKISLDDDVTSIEESVKATSRTNAPRKAGLLRRLPFFRRKKEVRKELIESSFFM